MDQGHGELLLGKPAPLPREYAPWILHAISREPARRDLGLAGNPPFFGVDQWHAYELSWLDENGRPVVRVGRIQIPADSPHIVESKSLKLYLNSLNHTRFASEEEARRVIIADIGAVTGAQATLALFGVGDPALAGARLPGICLDELPVTPGDAGPRAELLQPREGDETEETLYSHLLRSLCPVTGQPDWATVWVHYRGRPIEHASLLRYIIAYREHREFHEQCIERMYRDIASRFRPVVLHLQGFYTRRGGLDISPFRSSDASARALPRINRQ